MCVVLTPGETDIDEAPGCAPITTLQPKGVREKQSKLDSETKHLRRIYLDKK